MNSTESEPTIEIEIEALRSHIHEYRRAINDEGMWLFLATLGCWSVSEEWLQLSAIAVAVLLFSRRLQDRLSDLKSFSKMISTLRDRIAIELEDEDTKKARLYEIMQIKHNELSFISTIKEGAVFLLCWGFLTATLTYMLWS